MKPIRFVVLEDDPRFLADLIDELNARDDCEVIGSSDNIMDGFDTIIRLTPDALILDIELFGGTAFDLVKRMKQHQIDIPPIVIVTANVAFEAASEAIDVCGPALVKLIGKPFWNNWDKEFPDVKAAILSRMKRNNGSDEDSEISLNAARDSIFIRSSQMTYRIIISDILYLEVDGEGQTNIIMQDHRKILVRKTLSVLMKLLPYPILRINRFNAININKLLLINHEDDTLMIDGHPKPLTVGETYKERLRELMS